jgi:hypothetical protein
MGEPETLSINRTTKLTPVNDQIRRAEHIIKQMSETHDLKFQGPDRATAFYFLPTRNTARVKEPSIQVRPTLSESFNIFCC